MSFVLPSWKLALEGLAATAAVGLSAVTMFGADSAPKPRAVPVVEHAARQKAAGTTTTTTPPEPPAVDGGGSFGDGSFGGGSDSGSGSFGDPSTGAAAVIDPPTSPTTALDAGPPPVVSESEFPVALPISAVVIVGGGVGAVAWTRRRRAQGDSRR